MRCLRKLRDVEKLIEMHGDKWKYKVRVKSLQGINTARTIQRMLRRQVQEMGWRVRGLEHLDAAVEIHRLIGVSASLIDECIHHLEFVIDNDCFVGYEVLPGEPSTSTDQGRTERHGAPPFPFDRSVSSLVGDTGRGSAALLSRDSVSSLVGDTGRGSAALLSSDSATTLVGDTGRGRAALPSSDSATTLVGDTGGRAELPSSDSATGRGRAALPGSDSAITLVVGATGHGRAAFPGSDSATTLVLGATGRGRAALPGSDSASTSTRATSRDHTTVFDDVDHSAPRHDRSATRRVDNGNRAIAEPTLEAATGGRGQLPLTLTTAELDADHDMDFAAHRLFVSGTALRQHQIGSSSVQLVINGLGREIEEVADAVLDARFPPAVLLDKFRQLKKCLHKVWELRIPSDEFKQM